MLVDSHCHLDFYDPDEIPGVLERAAAAGVGAHPNVWCTLGIHPHNAAENPVPEVNAIVEMAAHPRCIGIGESGLDYHYDKSPRDVQRDNFRVHVRAAAAAGLPLAIHAREADADIITILQEEWNNGPKFSFLLHCFSSGRGLAEAALALGGYVSFSGILTFPKSHELRAIARDIPLDRLLVETDSPYLAPVPHRGRRNEPAWVAEVARVLAEVKGLPAPDLAEQTTANFRRLFAKTA